MRRQLKIHASSGIRVDDESRWTDADPLQVVGGDAVADVSLNTLTPILNRMEDMIIETKAKRHEEKAQLSLNEITDSQEAILHDIERWKREKLRTKSNDEAFYRHSEIHQKTAQAFLEISSWQMSPGNRCMSENMRLQHEQTVEHKRRVPHEN